MICPSSQASKLLLAAFALTLLYFVYMDVNLYLRVQRYPINAASDNASAYGEVSWVKCDVNPLCDVTVKAVLLDHTNYYLFAPLVTLLDDLLEISRWPYVTPNAISVFHVFVALLSARCVSSDSLSHRRWGVVLFEVRTVLDDLDGHVARVRKHVKGERSEVGSTGYYVDGICDALGCLALLVGAFVFLWNNPPRRGYMMLPTEGKEAATFKAKVGSNKVFKKLSCFTAQLLLSSMAWNRYIALYQDMLEGGEGEEAARQEEVFRSDFFFLIALLWRVVSVHNMVHCMLVAIFCDKLWEFLRAVQYVGFGVLLFVIGITEVHIGEAKGIIAHRAAANGTTF